MASSLIQVLGPQSAVLALATLVDLAVGDPPYRFHPVRLMGDVLNFSENVLRSVGADGYLGGVALFLVLSSASVAAVVAVLSAALLVAPWLALIAHGFIVYSLLAMGDLLRHAWRVERALADGGVEAARAAVSMMVGRDTTFMDAAACRRAAIESMSENLPDGFIACVFWYALAGLPGLVIFKVVSTMDSMVGFKNERYLRFGWCGARLDDVMNYIPARLSAMLIALVAITVPRCSPRKALTVAWTQHAVLPSPNSGWPEGATAGAIQRRLVGPIWKQGRMVTDIWLGVSSDPAAGTKEDLVRAGIVTLCAGLAAVALAECVLAVW